MDGSYDPISFTRYYNNSGMNSIEGNPFKTIVVDQKIQNYQNYYLVFKGDKSEWVKLCESSQIVMAAIIKYEEQRFNRIQKVYYPQKGDLGRCQGKALHSPAETSQINKTSEYRSRLRQRELTPISGEQFYFKPPPVKKEVKRENSHLRRQEMREPHSLKSQIERSRQKINRQRVKIQAQSKLQHHKQNPKPAYRKEKIYENSSESEVRAIELIVDEKPAKSIKLLKKQ